ncbi:MULTISPECIES: hypothetical protein [unclassified Vibrio]|uniref:hypothetical protein n=1 Tax=unclassified Vibrio TaxID=2614977 RepID=UPI002965713A|nr:MULTISPECIES: hypothetical protein [unclassified Vibrio]MDW1738879.1 hypothetical protein [Vibrio sp. Vb2321]MDW1808430.1 hypothetical protein [Vibrio sp. Vb2362]
MSQVLTAISSGLIGVLVGGLLSHRFNLWRDTRKEYNNVVIPVKHNISKALHKPHNVYLDINAIHGLQCIISNRQYEKVSTQVEVYKSIINAKWDYRDEKEFNVEQNTSDIINTLKSIDSLLKVK